MTIQLSNLVFPKDSMSRFFHRKLIHAATPLVDHGEQQRQTSQRPHDGGVGGGASHHALVECKECTIRACHDKDNANRKLKQGKGKTSNNGGKEGTTGRRRRHMRPRVASPGCCRCDGTHYVVLPVNGMQTSRSNRSVMGHRCCCNRNSDYQSLGHFIFR